MQPGHAIALAVILAGSAAACGDSQLSADGSDGAAVAACRSVLAQLSTPDGLATTVREEGTGFVVSAWTSGRAEGDPDYRCEVARAEDAKRGVEVVGVQSRDGAGAYHSTLDIDLDDS